MIALKLKRVLTGCEIGLKLRRWNVTGINVKSYIWVDKKKSSLHKVEMEESNLIEFINEELGDFVDYHYDSSEQSDKAADKAKTSRGWGGRERPGREKQPWLSPCWSACVPSQMKRFKGNIDKLELNQRKQPGWEHLIIMLNEGWLRFNSGKAGVSNVRRYRAFTIGKNQRTDETMVR